MRRRGWPGLENSTCALHSFLLPGLDDLLAIVYIIVCHCTSREDRRNDGGVKGVLFHKAEPLRPTNQNTVSLKPFKAEV